MSRIISSPVKRFPGTVTLRDPLYYPQALAMRRAIEAAKSLDPNSPMVDYNHAMLPGVIACVEEWNITGVEKHPTPDTFPVTPAQSAGQLAAWLIGEVANLYVESEDDVPKA